MVLIFTDAQGLYGRNTIRATNLIGSQNAIYTHKWDLPTWDKIRAVGDLPLFGFSYIGIFSIWLWAAIVTFLNSYLDVIKSYKMTQGWEWLQKLHDIPLTREMGLTLSALSILAMATTFYKIFCPSDIRVYSLSRWTNELDNEAIYYLGQSVSRKTLRWATATCYFVGGLWVVWLFVWRIFETIVILLTGS